jgi:uncharacterized protein (TIGR03382 family)
VLGTDRIAAAGEAQDEASYFSFSSLLPLLLLLLLALRTRRRAGREAATRRRGAQDAVVGEQMSALST